MAPILPLYSFLSTCMGLSHSLRNEKVYNGKGPELDYQILSENLVLLKARCANLVENIRSQISIYSSVELILLTFMILVINNTVKFQGDNT